MPLSFLWDYLCFSISWLTMLQSDLFVRVGSEFGEGEKNNEICRSRLDSLSDFFLYILHSDNSIFNLSFRESCVCEHNSFVSASAPNSAELSGKFVFFLVEILRVDEGIKESCWWESSELFALSSLSTSLSCIANMNNFSWLNEKVMPSLETRAHRRLHS